MQKRAGSEPHWPGAVAAIAAASLNLFLPAQLSASPGWIAVALVGALALAGILVPRWHQWLGHLASGVVTLQMVYALWQLIRDLAAHQGRPGDILLAALVIWTMNVLVFASWYWRLDAGGPHHRSHKESYGGAFLFPPLAMPPDVRKDMELARWRPRFIDYLFLAFTTSTAFSPTDSPVLSAWAKVLMMLQSSISLTTLAMVAARAVNIL